MSMSAADLAEQTRPYGAAANLVGCLQRIRTRNLPERIDDDFYRLAGVPEAAIYRARGALVFLRFIDEDGRPTDTLRALAAATDEEYRELLGAAIREAYSDDFARVDPAQDTQAQIVNAFRPYQPRSQTNRMVMLFLSLCREAGIQVLDAPRERNMRSPGAPRRNSSASGTTSSGRSGKTQTESQSTQPSQTSGPAASPADALFGLITQEDAAAMDQDEFKATWDAIGVAFGNVARARARKTEADAAKQAQAERDAADASDADEPDDKPVS